MPRGDGTGPAGLGPMTGRAAGYCAGFAMPGYMNPMPWRGGGHGRGWGRGRGWRQWRYPVGYYGAAPGYGVGPYFPPAPPDQEVRRLKAQAEHMEGALDEIRRRIAELEATQEKES